MLNRRQIKISSMFSFDGYRACLRGKSNEGRNLLMTSMVPLGVISEQEQYIKRLESFCSKKQKNTKLVLNEKYDKITVLENQKLYDFFEGKIIQKPFKNAAFAQIVAEILRTGRIEFSKLSVEDQVMVLLQILSVFATGRKGGCDLSFIGGKKKTADFVISSKFTNLRERFSDIRLIEMSASGLHEKQSQNLLELL